MWVSELELVGVRSYSGFLCCSPFPQLALLLHLEKRLLLNLQTDHTKRLSGTLRPDYCQRQDTDLNDPLWGYGLAVLI